MTDDAMRARVAGRMDVDARTVWELRIGAEALRCVATGVDRFMVQVRAQGRWSDLLDSDQRGDPLRLLRYAAFTGSVSELIALSQQEATSAASKGPGYG